MSLSWFWLPVGLALCFSFRKALAELGFGLALVGRWLPWGYTWTLLWLCFSLVRLWLGLALAKLCLSFGFTLDLLWFGFVLAMALFLACDRTVRVIIAGDSALL